MSPFYDANCQSQLKSSPNVKEQTGDDFGIKENDIEGVIRGVDSGVLHFPDSILMDNERKEYYGQHNIKYKGSENTQTPLKTTEIKCSH